MIDNLTVWGRHFWPVHFEGTKLAWRFLDIPVFFFQPNNLWSNRLFKTYTNNASKQTIVATNAKNWGVRYFFSTSPVRSIFSADGFLVRYKWSNFTYQVGVFISRPGVWGSETGIDCQRLDSQRCRMHWLVAVQNTVLFLSRSNRIKLLCFEPFSGPWLP